MIVAIHQPNYLPWIGYFYKMMIADCFVLFDNAQFSKGSVINRNKIKGPAGAQYITVPVRTYQGHLRKINEYLILMLRDVLEVKTKVVLASELEIDGKVNILSICQKLGASCYLSG